MNLDACLDTIFALDHLNTLYLHWNRISLETIKSALHKKGTLKRLEALWLLGVDRPISDTDILEICAYFPDLRIWLGYCPSVAISIEGVREWKRICPRLASVFMDGLSDEVNDALREMGVAVDSSEIGRNRR
jgi:hypothetical protein